MFDSYSKSPERSVLKIGLLLILGLICWVTLISFLWTTPEDSARAIERSAILKEHDQMCLNLPRPPDFHLASKMLGGNSFTRSISYRFESKLLWSQVTTFYTDRLPLLGWSTVDKYEMEVSPIPKSISFQKERYRVYLHHDSAGSASYPAVYGVGCSKILN